MSDWRDKAFCRDGVDPELFHPVGSSGPALLQADQAKAVCARCRVAEECLGYATRTGQLGIWGGTDEHERRTGKPRDAAPRKATSRVAHADVALALVELIAELAGRGLTDVQIGIRMNRSARWVCHVRKTHEIKAGYLQARDAARAGVAS